MFPKMKAFDIFLKLKRTLHELARRKQHNTSDTDLYLIVGDDIEEGEETGDCTRSVEMLDNDDDRVQILENYDVSGEEEETKLLIQSVNILFSGEEEVLTRSVKFLSREEEEVEEETKEHRLPIEFLEAIEKFKSSNLELVNQCEFISEVINLMKREIYFEKMKKPFLGDYLMVLKDFKRFAEEEYPLVQ